MIEGVSSQREPIFRAASVGILLLTVLLRILPPNRESQSSYSFPLEAVVSPVGTMETTELPSSHSINFRSLRGTTEEDFRRRIDPHDDQRYHDDREAQLQVIDVQTQWMALDQIHEEEADELDPERPCRKNNWETLSFPNCNSFHEVSNDPVEKSFLG